MKKLLIAFLLTFVALACGTVSGAGLLCGSAYAADTMPDGNGGSDPDGSGGGTDF